MSNQVTPAAIVDAVRQYRATAGAVVLPMDQREGTLASVYGGYSSVHVEQSIFAMADKLLPEYKGAFWEFVRCSNGGFYLGLDEQKHWQVEVDGNGYEGRMSGDAAGIVVCMMVYSHMSFSAQGELQDLLTEHYHKLREYLSEHPEASEIFAALD